MRPGRRPIDELTLLVILSYKHLALDERFIERQIA